MRGGFVKSLKISMACAGVAVALASCGSAGKATGKSSGLWKTLSAGPKRALTQLVNTPPAAAPVSKQANVPTVPVTLLSPQVPSSVQANANSTSSSGVISSRHDSRRDFSRDNSDSAPINSFPAPQFPLQRFQNNSAPSSNGNLALNEPAVNPGLPAELSPSTEKDLSGVAGGFVPRGSSSSGG